MGTNAESRIYESAEMPDRPYIQVNGNKTADLEQAIYICDSLNDYLFGLLDKNTLTTTVKDACLSVFCIYMEKDVADFHLRALLESQLTELGNNQLFRDKSTDLFFGRYSLRYGCPHDRRHKLRPFQLLYNYKLYKFVLMKLRNRAEHTFSVPLHCMAAA